MKKCFALMVGTLGACVVTDYARAECAFQQIVTKGGIYAAGDVGCKVGTFLGAQAPPSDLIPQVPTYDSHGETFYVTPESQTIPYSERISDPFPTRDNQSAPSSFRDTNTYDDVPLTTNRWSLKDARRLRPPAIQQTSTTSNALSAPTRGTTFGQLPGIAPGSRAQTTAARIDGLTTKYGVGGVKLDTAAAERMALNLDIDAAYYSSGSIILSGQQTSDSIDAALLLTAMRLACESRTDPYFSLDPPDPAAWAEQSSQVFEILWEHAQKRFGSLRPGFYNYSIRRDLSGLWARISHRFPALKSELVFNPRWLGDTRFGEIMYRADVLLKELSVGQSVLAPGTPFRGDKIKNYVSASKESVDRNLRESDSHGRRGYRLWFDLLPTGDRSNETASAVIYTSGSGLDLSEIYPKMFIRRHELGKDVDGAEPSLDKLAADVNSRTSLYSSAFKELKELTGIFRAYVAALKLTEINANVCSFVARTPLTDSERVSSPLPRFHEAEPFLAIGKSRTKRMLYMATNISVQGGISVRGRELFTARAVQKETPVIAAMRKELDSGVRGTEWRSNERNFIAFDMATRQPPPRAPISIGLQ